MFVVKYLKIASLTDSTLEKRIFSSDRNIPNITGDKYNIDKFVTYFIQVMIENH